MKNIPPMSLNTSSNTNNPNNNNNNSITSDPSPGHKAPFKPSLLDKGIVSVTGSVSKTTGSCCITIPIPPNPPALAQFFLYH